MKKKNILGGLVVVVVLLSGTTVLYFAGFKGPGITQALAEPVGSDDCPEGTFCGRQVGTDGGCAQRYCCQGTINDCTGSQKMPYSYPRLTSASTLYPGSCWKYTPQQVATCTSQDCTGTACYLVDSTCGPDALTMQTSWSSNLKQIGGACPVASQ